MNIRTEVLHDNIILTMSFNEHETVGLVHNALLQQNHFMKTIKIDRHIIDLVNSAMRFLFV